MRKFVVANWKMNMDLSSALKWLEEVEANLPDAVDTAVCAPYVYLLPMVEKAERIPIGAQNLAFAKSGAYTGEVAGYMLRDIGVKLVIIGHSERRRHFNETDEIIKLKLERAIENSLDIILCVGETLEQRRAGETLQVVKSQLSNALREFRNWERLTIAYEPVWAIGTGVPCEPEDAIEVINEIRQYVKDMGGQNIRVLYGGSIKPDNFEQFLKFGADGGLVGGASLSAESFSKLLKIASEYC